MSTDLTLGPVLFVRRGSRIVGLAVGALALAISLLVLMRLLGSPPGEESPDSTAVVFGVVSALLGLACWRSVRSGLWLCANGFRERGFFTSLTCAYSELSGLTHEDIVFDHNGHHHSVIIRFTAKGKPHKLFLHGRVGLDLSERRDPDADAIIKLLQSNRR